MVGVRWRSPAGSRVTIVHNWNNSAERAILRRINACLRLSFATVIDYHRSDHRDHFHCDTNRGRGRVAKGASNIVFVQEALNVALGAGLQEDGAYGGATARALQTFSGRSATDLANTAVFNSVIDDLFARIARG